MMNHSFYSQTPPIIIQGRNQGGRPPKIGKNMIFLRKIVIFHTKYPKNVRVYLRSAQIFKCAPPNLKSWIHPCNLDVIIIEI